MTLDPKTTALSSSTSAKAPARCGRGASRASLTRSGFTTRLAPLGRWSTIRARRRTSSIRRLRQRTANGRIRAALTDALGSDLEARLKAKGIQTVVVCGTSAQGVVLGTGSGSAQRGYKVIVPVDCMSSEDPCMEQYAAWHMYRADPNVVTAATTLTRSTMIKF